MFYSFVVVAVVALWASGSLIGETRLRKPAGCDFFTKQNAIKILGGDLTWSGTDFTEKDPKEWKCTFVSKLDESGPKLYFGLTRHSTEQGAKEAFESIRLSNKNHAGFEEWRGVGDEAVIHTDGVNFQFVMVRKGNRTVRMKVSQAGSVSLENVKAVAEELVTRMEAKKE